MVNRSFAVHGTLQIGIETNLMVIRARGPANTEMVLQYQREVNQYRQQLCRKPWASLTILSGEPLLPPEASGMLVESIKQAENMNLIATAVVFDDVQYKAVSEQFWEGIYQRTSLKHAFFDDEQKAKAWLASQLTSYNYSV
ncbi:hypothetical protein KO519_16805 [Paraglaciecola agarilytica]|uniref:hypothetical protein n=1 Tax=Paraglaciecola chathamensis TaxID=368405 RepID=UPI001C09EA17|nr:hypothetical protein [Paraglaciecola agarilytica]MBU3019342.1 hypothetical protein [Paraglaciecola agarilytica]